MVKLNNKLYTLENENIFSNVTKKVNEYKEKHKDVELVSLGIGDVSKPIVKPIIKAMKKACNDLSNEKTFKGYGAYYGYDFLKDKIRENDYKDFDFTNDEIYISNGAKTDSTSILELFPIESKILITDPMYPIYRDGAACLNRETYILKVDDSFIPNPPKEKYDIIYLNSPSNPIGITYSKEVLSSWIDYALKNNSVIIYDNVYASFIRSDNTPKSIYEIEGSKKCSIEIRSFSKNASFTGVRCSYYVIPKELNKDANSLWKKRTINRFNGADYIAQKGAEASYLESSKKQIQKHIDYYMENASYLKNAFEELGFKVLGGVDSPFMWVQTLDNLSSWDMFKIFLEEMNIIIIPGIIFGNEGDKYFRVSALGKKENIKKAVEKMKNHFNKNENKENKKPKMKKGTKILNILTLVGLVLGILGGIFLPNVMNEISFIGTIYINMLKFMIIPIIFTSIVVTIFNSSNKKDKVLLKTILTFIVMFVITFLITSIIILIVKPGSGFTFSEIAWDGEITEFSIASILTNLFPTNLSDVISKNAILPAIIFAVVCGYAASKVEDGETAIKVVESFKNIFGKILEMIMYITPAAVLSLVGSTIANYGNIIFGVGVKYILIAWICSIIALILVMILPAFLIGKVNPITYIKKASKIWLMTLTTRSSAATLPYTIKTCNEDFDIPEKVTNIVVPLGCTIHMCGGAVSFALLGLFTSQLFGVPITIGTFALMIISATLINMAAPGIPNGGIVIGATYLSILGIPLTFIGLYSGIYPLLDMAYTTLNVTGDITANIIINKTLE